MSNMINTTLEEICLPKKKAIISGPFGSNISSKYFVDTGIPVIRGNNLSLSLDKFYDDGFVFVTEDKADELDCYAARLDLIFTAAGTIGQVGVIPNDSKYERYVISNKQIRATIDTNKVDIMYAYYWFSSPWIQKLLMLSNKGSTVPLLSLWEIKKLPITYPKDIKEQKKIAKLLDTISQKIENNNKLNNELELMAKTIYDYWFLQFDFPNEEGKPYKSSGGKMVWNEELKREIPEGWISQQLNEIIETVDNRGKNPPYSEVSTNHPIIDVATLRTSGRAINYQECTKCVSDETYNEWFRAGHPQKGDILFSTVGSLAETKIYYPNKEIQASIAQNVIGMRMTSNLYSYIYQILNVEKEKIIGYKIGSVQPSLKVGHILEHKFVMPSKEILDKYAKIIEPVNIKVNRITEENRELSSLRDFLLPMLMNGQVGFKEVQ